MAALLLFGSQGASFGLVRAFRFLPPKLVGRDKKKIDDEQSDCRDNGSQHRRLGDYKLIVIGIIARIYLLNSNVEHGDHQYREHDLTG
ncbi:MAG: hypothetical protein ACJ8ER_00760 [Allosphingosinicella sp.]